MQKWEYVWITHVMALGSRHGNCIYTTQSGEEKKIKDGEKGILRFLNGLGGVGWEVAGVSTAATNLGMYLMRWTLKRPLAEEAG